MELKPWIFFITLSALLLLREYEIIAIGRIKNYVKPSCIVFKESFGSCYFATEYYVLSFTEGISTNYLPLYSAHADY